MVKTDKRIKKYTKKDGSTAYMFSGIYLGMNPKTGKPRKTTLSGFETATAAKNKLKRLTFEASQGIEKEINKAVTNFMIL